MTVSELISKLQNRLDGGLDPSAVVVVTDCEDEEARWLPVDDIFECQAGQMIDGTFCPYGPWCGDAPRQDVVYIGP